MYTIGRMGVEPRIYSILHWVAIIIKIIQKCKSQINCQLTGPNLSIAPNPAKGLLRNFQAKHGSVGFAATRTTHFTPIVYSAISISTTMPMWTCTFSWHTMIPTNKHTITSRIHRMMLMTAVVAQMIQTVTGRMKASSLPLIWWSASSLTSEPEVGAIWLLFYDPSYQFCLVPSLDILSPFIILSLNK